MPVTGPSFPVFKSGQGINNEYSAGQLLSLFCALVLSLSGAPTEAQEGPSVAILSLLAGPRCGSSLQESSSDHLIIASETKNRILLKGSAHSMLRPMDQDLATSPEPGTQKHSL